MTNVTADLETEVRRLRVRIIGLTSRQLAEAGERSPLTPSGRRLTRRETITEALAEFSEIGSGGRVVPDLGGQSLADQVVVLLEHGGIGPENSMSADDDEAQGDDAQDGVALGEARVSSLVDAAVRLRRALA